MLINWSTMGFGDRCSGVYDERFDLDSLYLKALPKGTVLRAVEGEIAFADRSRMKVLGRGISVRPV